MKIVRTVVAGLGLSLGAVMLPAAPASATIHEIVGQWCAGHGELQPPGIQSGKNLAQPVVSNGFVGDPVPFDPPGDQPAGLLLSFNFDSPSAKVVGTGTFVQIATTPAGPLYIQLVQPDPAFPAFMHCPMFATS